MDIALIVAMARNGTIGCNNQLPWHLSGDLRYFKARYHGQAHYHGAQYLGFHRQAAAGTH